MLEVIEQTDKLIDAFSETDFVCNMIKLKKKILDDNNRSSDVIKEYISNQNIFDFHIYYLNKEIDKIINNKSCGCNNEGN